MEQQINLTVLRTGVCLILQYHLVYPDTVLELKIKIIKNIAYLWSLLWGVYETNSCLVLSWNSVKLLEKKWNLMHKESLRISSDSIDPNLSCFSLEYVTKWVEFSQDCPSPTLVNFSKPTFVTSLFLNSHLYFLPIVWKLLLQLSLYFQQFSLNYTRKQMLLPLARPVFGK